MKFWCHHQRELKALLAAELQTEKDAHFQDLQVCAVEKSRLSRQARENDSLLTDIEVVCQRAERAGSYVPVREIYAILDRRP